jgi:hypothetical protein
MVVPGGRAEVKVGIEFRRPSRQTELSTTSGQTKNSRQTRSDPEITRASAIIGGIRDRGGRHFQGDPSPFYHLGETRDDESFSPKTQCSSECLVRSYSEIRNDAAFQACQTGCEALCRNRPRLPNFGRLPSLDDYPVWDPVPFETRSQVGTAINSGRLAAI